MVEHLNRNQKVVGSIPTFSTINVFKVVIYIKNKSQHKKLLLCASLACLLAVTYPYKKKYNPHYIILNEENGPFAQYSNGYVYIGDTEYLSSLHGITENDVLIKDERNYSDPNIAIYQSYNIIDKETRNEILEIISCYEIMYPSDWKRSIESMRLEWFCHNVSYYFNYKVDHSEEVDLNNADEDKYDIEIVRRLLRL